jgi:hypothetical protein
MAHRIDKFQEKYATYTCYRSFFRDLINSEGAIPLNFLNATENEFLLLNPQRSASPSTV